MQIDLVNTSDNPMRGAIYNDLIVEKLEIARSIGY
jgi:hypothetical protein